MINPSVKEKEKADCIAEQLISVNKNPQSEVLGNTIITIPIINPTHDPHILNALNDLCFAIVIFLTVFQPFDQWKKQELHEELWTLSR